MKLLAHIGQKSHKNLTSKQKKSLDVESPEYFQCKKIHKDEWLERLSGQLYNSVHEACQNKSADAQEFYVSYYSHIFFQNRFECCYKNEYPTTPLTQYLHSKAISVSCIRYNLKFWFNNQKII